MERLITMTHARAPFVRAAVGAFAAAFLLAGCASQPGADVSAHPLQDYLDRIQVMPSEDEQRETNAEIEEVTARCMTELGFEYQPSADSGGFIVADAGQLDPTSPEFMRTYGYGVSTNPWGDPGEYEDPNQEYRDSLSDSQLDAYQDALYGDPVDVDGSDTGGTWDWTKSGCSGRAFHEVLGDDSGFDDPEVTAVAQAQSTIQTEAAESPAVKETLATWADCMGSAGYDVKTKDEPRAAIQREMDALWAELPDGSTEDPASIAPDPTKLSDLQAKEVATATADADCSEQSGYDTALAEEVQQREAAYVAEHRDELEALVARYADK
ncbi:hypothetical protein DVJ78_01445 [Humibacter sp. BT305]|nr:hypothetical protein DVJ78_01445 [Humibacter sp. BT305]